MPRLIQLDPGPLTPEVVEQLTRSEVVLIEPNPAVEAKLGEMGIAYTHLGPDPISFDAVLIQGKRPLDELVWVVDRLLGPGGCPWDQAQTHESLKKYLLEEVYEVIDAIDARDDEKLCEELGDLILQPIMHGQIRHLAGGFDTDQLAQGIVDKLIRRHPHVFGDVTVADANEVLRNWDKIKQGEKGEVKTSILGGVPKGMASLLRAHEVSKRAARAGFEWPNIDSVFEKLHEEEAELMEALSDGAVDHVESELGDLLFTVVNISRWAGVEPEEALRKMLNRFTTRFMHMEHLTTKDLRSLSPEEWDDLWNQAKEAKG